jgi:hypothetical protein
MPLSGVAFTDTLPAGLVVSTPSGLSGSCGGGTVTATAGSRSVTLTGATLAGDATCTITINVTGTSEGVEQESTMVSSTNGGTGAPASANLFVGLPPSITASFAPTSITLGATTTLSFTVKNPNATTTLSGIALFDALPAGLVVASPTGAQGTCGGGMLTAVPGSGMFSFAGGQLAPGTSCTVSLIIDATQAGISQNTAGPVSSTQSGVAGSASATLTVTPPSNPTPTVPLPSSPTPTVVPPNEHFTVSHIKTHRDGTITLQVTIPGPGTIDVLETAWDGNLAHATVLGQPAKNRFVYAREHISSTIAGVIRIRVRPNAGGRRLVHHHTYRVVLRLWVTYMPIGGAYRTLGFYGLHLPM